MLESLGVFRQPVKVVIVLATDSHKDIRRYGDLGIDLFANTMVGLAIGYFLDRWLRTSPWLMIAGIVFGSAAGFMTVLRRISKIQEEEEKEKDD